MKNKIIIVISIIISVIIIKTRMVSNDTNENEIVLPDTSNNSVVLIEPKYSTNETIVASYVLSPSSDHNSDRSDDIQNALNKCSSDRGGTVFLKPGIYRVSKTILIPRGCTLYGDWQDPDTSNPQYGTIITADVNNTRYEGTDMEKTGLFKMSSGSGAVGLTIYYLNQGYANGTAKDQPWTFYYGHGELDWENNGNDYTKPILYTIKNVTLINSFRGIGESITEKNPYEMLVIENVKGSTMYKGILVHNSSDVGTLTNITLKPDYWANANLSALGSSNSKPSTDQLVNYIREISGMGLSITDAEMYQFANITISGFKYGIFIPGKWEINNNGAARRNMGSGVMYNINISNCLIGINAGDDYYVHHHLGYQISHSKIEGTEYSINNNSASMYNGKQTGVFKLTDVTLSGKTNGYIVYNNDLSSTYKDLKNVSSLSSSASLGNIYTNRKTKTRGKNIIALNAGTSEDEIQRALNSVGQNGGGVVYLKPGLYQVTKQINVPENVELRGSSSVLNRFAGKPGSSGAYNTVVNIDPTKISSGAAAVIELAGDNAGVSGIIFTFEKNIESMKGSSPTYTKSAPAIGSHNTKYAYITNVTISGASHGIAIDSCKYFTINNVATTSFENFIAVVNSEAGLIKNTLGNSTVLSLNILYDFYHTNFINLINATHNNLDYLLISNSKNIEGLNNFVYGPRTYLALTNSTGYFVNNGNDSWSDISNKKELTMYNIYNSNSANVVIVNSHRYNGDIGKLYTESGSGNIINIYNSLAMIVSSKNNDSKYEKNVVGSSRISPISSSSIPEYVAKKPSVTKGDVNGDGKISSADYVVIRKYLLGSTTLTDSQKLSADMNSDGNITSQDYILIRKKIIEGV